MFFDFDTGMVYCGFYFDIYCRISIVLLLCSFFAGIFFFWAGEKNANEKVYITLMIYNRSRGHKRKGKNP